MTRKDCQKYLLENIGFVPLRSGCTICKYNKGIKFEKVLTLEEWIKND